MKKKLILRLLLLGILSVSIQSCRTDEMLTTTEQTQKEKIALFERFEKERNLAKGAASNYAIPFGYSMLAYFSNYPEKKIELEGKYGMVDLSVSSQDIDLDNGRKLLIFPMLTNGKVTAVIGGVINAERDYLYFDVYKEGHPDRDYLIESFQDHYDTKIAHKGDANNPTNVGEVIITIKKPKLTDPGDGGSDGGTGGHDMGGGNGDYTDGGSGGSGSSGTPNTTDNTDPCAEMKAQKTDPKYQAAQQKLQGATGSTSESGFRVGNPVSGQTGTQYQELANKPGTSQLEFKIFNSTYGIMHSHYDGLIKMFSPTDVNLFIQLLKNAKANGIPLTKVYLSIVTSDGNYQLRGSNSMDPDNMNMFPPDKIAALDQEYQKQLGNPNISREALQKDFLKFIENSMKVDGMKLFEVDENGKSAQVNQNGSKTDCPS